MRIIGKVSPTAMLNTHITFSDFPSELVEMIPVWSRSRSMEAKYNGGEGEGGYILKSSLFKNASLLHLI